jgi:nicotinamidase-related amidase
MGTGASFWLHPRVRQPVQGDGGDRWETVVTERVVPASATALLLCDVWDQHWCRAAAARVDAMAPRINRVVERARAHGARIIHAPSETMAFYAGTPARQRALALPPVAPPPPLARPDPPLPIDDSDGGCDSGEVPWYRAWTRQHPAIAIADDDLIADDGATVYSYLRHHGLTTLIVMGVHTNMCVLNRSFAIKQMTRWGVACLLARDLTDALYNPARPPYVSQAAGTALVIEHIERYWCPSILSDDLIGGEDDGRTGADA